MLVIMLKAFLEDAQIFGWWACYNIFCKVTLNNTHAPLQNQPFLGACLFWGGGRVTVWMKRLRRCVWRDFSEHLRKWNQALLALNQAKNVWQALLLQGAKAHTCLGNVTELAFSTWIKALLEYLLSAWLRFPWVMQTSLHQNGGFHKSPCNTEVARIKLGVLNAHFASVYYKNSQHTER